MENNTDTIENEESNIIYSDTTPDPINPLVIKFDPDTGVIINVKTGKDLTVDDVAIHYGLSVEAVLKIVARSANQERRMSNV